MLPKNKQVKNKSEIDIAVLYEKLKNHAKEIDETEEDNERLEGRVGIIEGKVKLLTKIVIGIITAIAGSVVTFVLSQLFTKYF